MIVALHAASGAAAGALSRSPWAALALGPVLHLAGDRVPHRHPANNAGEVVVGAAALGLLGLRRGWLDPATLGAFASVLPDVEHLLPAPGGRRLALVHRRAGGDRRDGSGLSAGRQLLFAVLLLVPLLAPARRG